MKNYIINDLNLDGFEITQLAGIDDSHLKLIEQFYNVKINIRGDEIIINNCNDDIFNNIKRLFESIVSIIRSGYKVESKDIVQIINLAQNNELEYFEKLHNCFIGKTFNGKVIAPKTLGQLKYVEAIKRNDIVFGIGPAGTGKTYIAVVHAVNMLKSKLIKKIILTRPAVEAGESLGFLPGDLKEKVDPYLRPLYDALDEMLGKEVCEKYLEKGIIEIAPLAYMRGRTLDDAYIILDEAQNTTIMQMKMFLTRLGFNSKMIITGDISQIDLKPNITSGLKNAINVLENIDGINFTYLNSKDVVRHPLVQQIIDAYEEK